MSEDITYPNDLVLVHKAQSIIQRDSLTNELAQAGIEVTTAPRDMSRKVADDTIDLALEGYSAMFDGFAMYVKNRDKSQAEAIIHKFLAAADATGRELAVEAKPNHMRKYLFCALFSIMLPGLMHIFGIYHLSAAVRKGERIQPLMFIAGTLLYIFTLVVIYVVIRIW